MIATLAGLMQMVRETLNAPRAGARRIMALDLPIKARWSALVLMAIGSAVLTHISFAMLPPNAREFFGEAMTSPFRTAVLQFVAMVVGVHAIHRIGQMRGGQGNLADSIILVAWLQFILLCLQGVQILAQVILPLLAELIGLGGVVLFFWLLTNFVAELHGFKSLQATFFGVLGAMLALGFVLIFLFTLLFGGAAPGV
ncbi:MAG: Yip1 family protein [Paracoccaceae bacterium]|nr:Yip1 family protein [Paracoccaceae bacterium]